MSPLPYPSTVCPRHRLVFLETHSHRYTASFLYMMYPRIFKCTTAPFSRILRTSYTYNNICNIEIVSLLVIFLYIIFRLKCTFMLGLYACTVHLCSTQYTYIRMPFNFVANCSLRMLISGTQNKGRRAEHLHTCYISIYLDIL